MRSRQRMRGSWVLAAYLLLVVATFMAGAHATWWFRRWLILERCYSYLSCGHIYLVRWFSPEGVLIGMAAAATMALLARPLLRPRERVQSPETPARLEPN